jgi:hypothetical protein
MFLMKYYPISRPVCVWHGETTKGFKALASGMHKSNMCSHIVLSMQTPCTQLINLRLNLGHCFYSGQTLYCHTIYIPLCL